MANHDFLTVDQVLNFLAQNTINAFFYEENTGRGLSSVIDLALAVQRPVAITKSTMFRHLRSTLPSICIEDLSLKEIIHNGFAPLHHYCQEWNEANLVWDYERIIDCILAKDSKTNMGQVRRIKRKIFNRVRRKKHENFWVPTIEPVATDDMLDGCEKFESVSIPNVISFNRILDAEARKQYKPCVDALFRLLPEMMSRKIPEANVQQAFVLDTVHKFIDQYESPSILCVGSYDDTAFTALKKYGHKVDEVDPVINYDLSTFLHKPTTIMGGYDIVFSTSVIEHVKDDELFISQIADLLASGGVGVLTCDYNDQFKPGDNIPTEDFHMYTQKDFFERFLPKLRNCSLVDKPQWDCPNPDFEYAGYQYTFATFVFRKM